MIRINKPFRCVFHILKPTHEEIYGASKTKWEDIGTLHASVKTFGGTESTINGVLSVESTKVVQTNYNTKLKAAVRLRDEYGVQWEMLGEPEDLEEKHRFMQFKIRKVTGGAK